MKQVTNVFFPLRSSCLRWRLITVLKDVGPCWYHLSPFKVINVWFYFTFKSPNYVWQIPYNLFRSLSGDSAENYSCLEATSKRLWVKRSKTQKHLRLFFWQLLQTDQQKLTSIASTVFQLFFNHIISSKNTTSGQKPTTGPVPTVLPIPSYFCQKMIFMTKSYFPSFESVCSFTSLLSFSVIQQQKEFIDKHRIII